jgi:hypothetical protein
MYGYQRRCLFDEDRYAGLVLDFVILAVFLSPVFLSRWPYSTKIFKSSSYIPGTSNNRQPNGSLSNVLRVDVLLHLSWFAVCVPVHQVRPKTVL